MGDQKKIGRGSDVRVVTLKGIEGLRVRGRYARSRRAGQRGTVTKPIPGHGNDVFYVRHEDGSEGVYRRDELERIV